MKKDRKDELKKKESKFQYDEMEQVEELGSGVAIKGVLIGVAIGAGVIALT